MSEQTLTTDEAARLDTAAARAAVESVQTSYLRWVHQSDAAATGHDVSIKSYASVLLWALQTAEKWGAAVQRTPADLALSSLIAAINSRDLQQVGQLCEQAEKTLLTTDMPIRTRMVWTLVFGCAALYTSKRSGMPTYLDALAELAAVDAGCVVDQTVMPHLGPAAQRRWDVVTLPGLRAAARSKAREHWRKQIADQVAALAQEGPYHG